MKKLTCSVLILVIFIPITSFAGEIKGLGISYDQLMNYLSNSFKMGKSIPLNGQDRYIGQTSDGLLTLELIGDKQNIIQAGLIIGIPNDNSKAIITNSAILLRFLKNAVPEWPNSADWATNTINKINNSTIEKEKKVYRNKIIEISVLRNMGMILISIKPK